MMKLFKVVFFFVFSFHLANACAQDVPNKSFKKNTVFLELGGNGFINSINYDRLFTLKDSLISVSFRLGFGLYKSNESDSSIIKVLPLEVNFLLGKKQNYLELGFGYTPSFGYRTFRQNNVVYATKNFDFNIIGRVGYRYQKPEGGIFFRLGFTPIIYRDYINAGKFKIAPWGGISAGISF